MIVGGWIAVRLPRSDRNDSSGGLDRSERLAEGIVGVLVSGGPNDLDSGG